jgi:hypothetical protein
VKPGPSHERKIRDLHYSTSTHDSGGENKGNEGAGQVTRMGEKRNVNRILVSKSEGMYHLKDLGIDRMITLK